MRLCEDRDFITAVGDVVIKCASVASELQRSENGLDSISRGEFVDAAAFG